MIVRTRSRFTNFETPVLLLVRQQRLLVTIYQQQQQQQQTMPPGKWWKRGRRGLRTARCPPRPLQCSPRREYPRAPA